MPPAGFIRRTSYSSCACALCCARSCAVNSHDAARRRRPSFSLGRCVSFLDDACKPARTRHRAEELRGIVPRRSVDLQDARGKLGSRSNSAWATKSIALTTSFAPGGFSSKPKNQPAKTYPSIQFMHRTNWLLNTGPPQRCSFFGHFTVTE